MGVRFVAMVVRAYFAAYPELPDLFGYPQPCIVTVCGGAAPRGAPGRLDLLATQRPRLRRLSGGAVALEQALTCSSGFGSLPGSVLVSCCGGTTPHTPRCALRAQTVVRCANHPALRAHTVVAPPSLSGLDRGGGCEGLADAGDHGCLVAEQFAPREVDDLVAQVSQLLISSQLPDGGALIGVLDRAVSLGDHPVPGPVEIDAVPEIRSGDGELKLRRLEALFIENHPGTRLKYRFRARVAEVNDA